MMRIHFIAIGGSAMHNLAIALKKKAYRVTGSDDEIFEPSRSRLSEHGLLPEKDGWHPENIHHELDAVILGMHARNDNPELLEAQKLGVRIYSYPEYLYEQTKNKKRIVVGGSHGKTSITSMVLHVLQYFNVDFDYMVGAKLEGFDTMVRLNETSNLAVFEGDEYLSSPIDSRPKFHHYRPHIALISGIAWDHINVFPTFKNYLEQFDIFAHSIQEGGSLIYFNEDDHLLKIADGVGVGIKKVAYSTPSYVNKNGRLSLKTSQGLIPLKVFGEHNLQNIAGAKLLCKEVGISDAQFYEAIQSFSGSARRLELAAENEETTIFYDFAHSPSKLKATTRAVKQQFQERELVAVMELHTFSSLKKEFLPLYENSMQWADQAFVFYNPETIAHKRLEPISEELVKQSFGNVEVYTNADELFEHLKEMTWKNKNLLMMTSGNFSGKNVIDFAKELIQK